jgi:hypothetical protein
MPTPIEETNRKLLLASSATTDEELLELLKTYTPGIEQAIIDNPNSSWKVLETIWRENIDSDTLSYGTVCSLISHQNFSTSLLDEHILRAVKGIVLPKSNVFLAVSLRGRVSASVVSQVFENSDHLDLLTAYFLSNKYTPFELKFELALSGHQLAQGTILSLDEDTLKIGMKSLGYELDSAPKEWIPKIFGWEEPEWQKH